ASPFPKEADVRPAPTLFAELLGTPTPLELMLSSDSRTPSATPYFLDHAGLPNAPGGTPPAPVASSTVPSPPTPSLPSASAVPSASASPSVPSPSVPSGLSPQPGFGGAPSGVPYAPSALPPAP